MVIKFNPFLFSIENFFFPSICIQVECNSEVESNHLLCPKCREHLSPLFNPKFVVENFSFHSRFHAYSFGKIQQTLLYGIKYRYKPSWISKIFQEYLLSDTQNLLLPYLEQFEVMVPVPLSALKLRTRGFNQSLVIAETMYRIYGKPQVKQLLKKPKELGSSTKRNRRQRAQLIQNQFQLHPNFEKLGSSKIPHSVLLIDDVYTTGATLEACAGILKKAGVSQIGVFTLFYTEPHNTISQLNKEWENVAALAF